MQKEKPNHIADHLANERTYLAWIRTALGVITFGFLVVKFSFFLEQFSMGLKKDPTVPNRHYSDEIGIFLVVFGAFISVFAYYRFKNTEKQIEDNTYKRNTLLITILTVSIFIISILLIFYLIASIKYFS